MNCLSKRARFLVGFLLLMCPEIFAQDPDFHIYLAFGQSNMCGAGEIEQQDKTVDERFQVMYPMVGCSMNGREFGKWYDAIPPLWGCPNGGLGPADYFGRKMVEELPSEIKVGVIVVAVPGCDIRLFNKTVVDGLEDYTYGYVPSKYNRSAYAWLLDLAKMAQEDGVIKGLLLHQGETMPDAARWPGDVKRVFDDLIADLDLPETTPLLVGEMLYADAGGACGGHNTTVNTIGKVIPSAHVISADGLSGKDQFHFNAASERIFGARYAEEMLSLLETTGISREGGQPVTSRTGGLSEINPFTITTDAVRIRLSGDFICRIFNFSGMLMQTVKGMDGLTVGADLPAGVYLISIRQNTCLLTVNFFKR